MLQTPRSLEFSPLLGEPSIAEAPCVPVSGGEIAPESSMLAWTDLEVSWEEPR